MGINILRKNLCISKWSLNFLSLIGVFKGVENHMCIGGDQGELPTRPLGSSSILTRPNFLHSQGMQHGPSNQCVKYDDFRGVEYESYPWGLVVNSSRMFKEHLHIHYLFEDCLHMNYILKEHLAMDHFHEDKLHQLHIHILVVDDIGLAIKFNHWIQSLNMFSH